MSVIRDWLTGTLAGRALLVGLVTKSVTVTMAALTGPLSGIAAALDTIGGIAVVAGVAILIYRLSIVAKRRLLWRVRRKLTLSYIFIGVVPALLIVAFFLLSGLLLFFNVSSYLVQSRLRTLVDQTQFLAQTAALELQRSADVSAFEETLERREAGASARYPNASYAVVPVQRTCDGNDARGSTRAPTMPITAGEWRHLPAPDSLPDWVMCEGYAGLIVYGDQTRLVARGVAFPDVAMPRYAVIVDVPLGPEVARRLRD